jgi:hypothetical protein
MSPTSTIVLAIACAGCCQVSRIPVYDNRPQIQRCSACGQHFTDAEALVEAYQQAWQALTNHAALTQAHHAARAAIYEALTHWPRKAAREALQRAAQTLGYPG